MAPRIPFAAFLSTARGWRLLLPAALLLVGAAPLRGQDAGFGLLTIGPGTHALGLNEAATAALLGPAGLYANPANLALESSSAFSADYSLWIGGLRNSHLSVNLPSGRGAWAFGIRSQASDDFELRARPGPSQGRFSVGYLSLAAGYARKIGRFSAGAAVQYLREEIYVYDADGYAFNLGISSEWMNRNLRVSAALLNLGRMSPLNVESTDLPARFKAGTRARLLRFAMPRDGGYPMELSLYADYIVPVGSSGAPAGTAGGSGNERESYANVALSLDIAGTLALYSGYKGDGGERPFTFGSTLRLEGIHISYALIPFETGFGTAHSVGLQYRF